MLAHTTWLTNRRPRSPSCNHNVKEPCRKTNYHLPSETTPTASSSPAFGVGAVYRRRFPACQTVKRHENAEFSGGLWIAGSQFWPVRSAYTTPLYIDVPRARDHNRPKAGPSLRIAAKYRKKRTARADFMTAIDGWTAKGFEGVRDAFAAAQAEDSGGAQLCIWRHGETVLDVWAGRDARGRPSVHGSIAHHPDVGEQGHHRNPRAYPRRARRARSARADRAHLAGIRAERKRENHHRARADAFLGAGEFRRRQRLRGRGHERLGQMRRPAGAHGALVGAGHGVFLSRADLWLPDRRDDPGGSPASGWANFCRTR